MNIVIADPQARVRFSLRTLLNQQAGWQVTGEAADCTELLDFLCKSSLDLVLVDCNLPGMPVEDLLGVLQARCPALRVIAMSGRLELRQTALAAGADGFLSKTEPPDRLLDLIRAIQTQAADRFWGKGSNCLLI